FLKVLIGFIPAMCTFMYTQHWWVLMFFGAPIWFSITGARNVIQMLIAGGGIRKNMMLNWTNYVNWTRVCDSLMYTGMSVILLEGLTRNLLLAQVLGLTVENHSLLVFTIIALANGTYISSHNIYRGFPRSAVVGNFFRSVLAIPVAVVYNAVLGVILPLITSMPPEQILVPAAAIVSKFASDTVAGVIESTADRRNFFRLRNWDYTTKLKNLFDCYTQMEIAYPEQDALKLLEKPQEFAKFMNDNGGKDLKVRAIITALDLMYFWYYQPCSQQTFVSCLRKMSAEERDVIVKFQGVLTNMQEISQLFIEGMLGDNFSRALSFYLDNHKSYIAKISKICKDINEGKLFA
ncbi:MAG: hypothetical protein HUK26_06995, partial [Duodenibacillus sp.]|nr:hypothetical protein [Duodenibacillus sp.]